VKRCHVHTSDRRSLAGTSLAAETFALRYEKSRLKAGCSHDWLPHKGSIVSAERIIFNVKGNAYRLVAAIDFEKGIV
jgi:mRNA-degrading endonuclease HigB of HigAB toxin-antitoxin module